jgi:flavin reductase (DIM6/NTAB) family NADH-FMN oxidoreductase RutF
MSVDVPSATAVLDHDTFRRFFRRHPAGVAVVTLDAGAGPVGFTATSFTSVSARPPLATVAVDRESTSWPHLHAARSVVVNLLGPDGGELARRFATRGLDRFAAPTRWHRLPTGEPVLDDAAHWLRASVAELVPVGDHELAVLLVEHLEVGAPGPGLVYHDGGFAAVRGDA